MTTDCDDCGSDVERHGPAFAAERRDGERVDVDAFCNDARLAARIESGDRTAGTCCEVDR